MIGVMDENIKECLQMIRKKDMVNILFQTEQFTKEIGLTISSMEEVKLHYQMEQLRLDNGVMGSEFLGRMKDRQQQHNQEQLMYLSNID